MDRIDARRLATIIETAPILTRLGLAAPDQRCRERAALTLAEMVADRLTWPETVTDDRQLGLSL